MAAETAGITPIEYFVRHQLKVAAVVIPVVAFLHLVWQRWCDRREAEPDDWRLDTDGQDETENRHPPLAYALLPLLPLALLFVFSPLVMHSIRLDVVTAMLISLAVSMVCEAIRRSSLSEALELIVSRVKQAMEVDVCSVYLTDKESGSHTLMATEGLNPEAIGKVVLTRNDGVVGLVAERQEPVNLEAAAEHPRYHYFPETGEERYKAFLGVPIIHQRR